MAARISREGSNAGQYVFDPGTKITDLDQSNLGLMSAWENRFGDNGYGSNELAYEREKMKLEQERADAMRAQGLMPDGSPIRPDWESLVGPDGTLKDQYQLQVERLDPSQMEGYQKYKSEAMRTGPSAWANLQLEQQQNQNQLDKGSAARQAMTAQSQAQSGLAMRGGLSGGARALLAGQGARELLNSRQKVQQGTNAARLQTLSTDEGNRIQQLGNLASSEQDIGKYNTTLGAQEKERNLTNLLKEVEGKRGYDMGTYQEQMKKWAADKQAGATASSGGGGK